MGTVLCLRRRLEPVKGLKGMEKQEMGAGTQEGPSTREKQPGRPKVGMAMWSHRASLLRGSLAEL